MLALASTEPWSTISVRSAITSGPQPRRKITPTSSLQQQHVSMTPSLEQSQCLLSVRLTVKSYKPLTASEKTRLTQRGERMTKIGEVYLCSICGNKVKIVEAGKGTLVCCGKPMSLVK
jgi:desulfoferrodoxin-like iron-binding protein